MADDVLQIFAEGRVDARSLSEFLFKPADFMVQRRLAPPINTLNFYLDKFDAVAADANSAISIANNSIGAANALIADANTKMLAANGVVANAYAGAEQRFFDTANNNLNSQIDVYLSAQDIGKSVFDTPQQGIDAGIANGSYYSVRSADSDYFLEEYKNNAGTPQATGKKYPAAKFLLTKGVFTVSELLILGATATAGARFNTHGFYAKGDCLPSVFEVQTVAVGDEFTDIGNGTLIGSDASIKVNSTKKLKLVADNSVALSQLGGIKTAQSVTIKNDVIGSIILKNYKRLIVDGFYTLRGTLWHYENNIITGIGKKISGIRMGDNVNKHPIQSANSNIKALVILNERIEIKGLTLDGNYSKNSNRDYTQDINLTYWGYGMLLFNVQEIYLKDLHVRHTEAYGICYRLSDLVHAENISFDQEVGVNKDGITGSGKRVTYRNISGFTSDDLCAVGTGTSSMTGHDNGITVNQDSEYIEIDGVHSLKKGDQGSLYAVGVYGADGCVHKKVKISNVTGYYDAGVIRVANYWYENTNLKIDRLELENICPNQLYKSNRYLHLFASYIDCNYLIINGLDVNIAGSVTATEGAHAIQLRGCKVANMQVSNVNFKQRNTTQNITLMTLTIGGFVRHLKVSFVDIDSSNIVDYSDVTSTEGNFYLVSSGTRQIRTLDVSEVDIGTLNEGGYTSNLKTINREYSASLNIDRINLNQPVENYIELHEGVTDLRGSVRIKNSNLYLNINALVDTSKLNLELPLFTIKDVIGFDYRSVRVHIFPTVSDGVSFYVKIDGQEISNYQNSITGVESTGLKRLHLRATIPIM